MSFVSFEQFLDVSKKAIFEKMIISFLPTKFKLFLVKP